MSVGSPTPERQRRRRSTGSPRTGARHAAITPSQHALAGWNVGRLPPADALVLFGATGDLAKRKLFPALYHMEERGELRSR